MFWLPESPHWLVTNNKTKDLQKTMQRLIDINRSKLDLKVRLNLYPRYPVNSSYYSSTWWLAQSLYFSQDTGYFVFHPRSLMTDWDTFVSTRFPNLSTSSLQLVMIVHNIYHHRLNLSEKNLTAVWSSPQYDRTVSNITLPFPSHSNPLYPSGYQDYSGPSTQGIRKHLHHLQWLENLCYCDGACLPVVPH